jgi:hypothetical protein
MRKLFKAQELAVGLCIIAAGSLVQDASASTLLSGSVFLNPTTDLYTYSYTIDNTSSSPVFEMSILVSNVALNGVQLTGASMPLAYTAPNGWSLGVAVSGSIANPPYNENGSFYQFYTPTNTIAAGSALSGFSFTTWAAPTTSPLNNYFVDTFGGIVEFGNTVAPNIVSPLPAALPLYGAGLGAMGLLAWYRKRKSKTAILAA